MRLSKANDILIRLGLSETQFTRALAAANVQVGAFQKSTTTLSKAIRNDLSQSFKTAATAAALFAVVAGMAIIKSIDTFREYNLQLIEIRKTTDLAWEDTKALGEEFRAMSNYMPTTASELGAIAAMGGRLGLSSKEDIIPFTDTVAKMAAVTDLSAEDAANALARIANATRTPIKDINKLGSVINELDNTTATSTSNIVNAMMRAAASASVLGVKADDIAALSATLVAAGTPAERAGTQLNRMFSQMAIKLDVLAAQMGISASEMRKRMDKDVMGVLIEYIQKLNKVESSTKRIQLASQAFGDIGAKALNKLAISYPHLVKNLKTAHTQFQIGTSLNAEYKRSLESLDAQIKILQNRLNNVAISIGETFMPTILKMVDYTEPMIKEIQKIAVVAVSSFNNMMSKINWVGLKGALADVEAGFGNLFNTMGSTEGVFDGLAKAINIGIDAFSKLAAIFKRLGIIAKLGTTITIVGIAVMHLIPPIAGAIVSVKNLTLGFVMLNKGLLKTVSEGIQSFIVSTRKMTEVTKGSATWTRYGWIQTGIARSETNKLIFAQSTAAKTTTLLSIASKRAATSMYGLAVAMRRIPLQVYLTAALTLYMVWKTNMFGIRDIVLPVFNAIIGVLGAVKDAVNSANPIIKLLGISMYGVGAALTVLTVKFALTTAAMSKNSRVALIASKSLKIMNMSVSRMFMPLKTLSVRLNASLLSFGRFVKGVITGSRDVSFSFRKMSIVTKLSTFSIKRALITTGGVIKGFGIAVKTALGPFGLLMIAFDLLYEAYQSNFLGLKDAIDGMIEKLKEFVSKVLEIFEPLINAFKAVGEALGSLFGSKKQKEVKRYGKAVSNSAKTATTSLDAMVSSTDAAKYSTDDYMNSVSNLNSEMGALGMSIDDTNGALKSVGDIAKTSKNAILALAKAMGYLVKYPEKVPVAPERALKDYIEEYGSLEEAVKRMMSLEEGIAPPKLAVFEAGATEKALKSLVEASMIPKNMKEDAKSLLEMMQKGTLMPADVKYSEEFLRSMDIEITKQNKLTEEQSALQQKINSLRSAGIDDVWAYNQALSQAGRGMDIHFEKTKDGIELFAGSVKDWSKEQIDAMEKMGMSLDEINEKLAMISEESEEQKVVIPGVWRDASGQLTLMNNMTADMVNNALKFGKAYGLAVPHTAREIEDLYNIYSKFTEEQLPGIPVSISPDNKQLMEFRKMLDEYQLETIGWDIGMMFSSAKTGSKWGKTPDLTGALNLTSNTANITASNAALTGSFTMPQPVLTIYNNITITPEGEIKEEETTVDTDVKSP